MALGGVVPDTTTANLLVILVATALIWIGSGWLEGAAEELASHYGLPAVVQGSVIVAIGSSFPEFTSVVVAAYAGAFDLGVGAIVGSAIFNILVIPALSGLASDSELEASRAIVYKEAQFYMIAVAALVITFALAVIYEPAGSASALVGELTRPLAVLPLLVYVLYLFIQWQDVGDYDAGASSGDVAVGRAWLTLGAGLLLILVAVEGLVGSVESLALSLGVPEFFAGVTILAGVTSLPDTIVSVRSARDDRAGTSLGNVLGSNTFDLLVALPVGVLVVGSVPVDFAVAVPMLGVLTLATVLLFVLIRTELTLTRAEAYALLVGYGLFVGWVTAESAGLTQLVRGG